MFIDLGEFKSERSVGAPCRHYQDLHGHTAPCGAKERQKARGYENTAPLEQKRSAQLCCYPKLDLDADGAVKQRGVAKL